MARVSTFDDWLDLSRGWQDWLGLDKELA